MNLLNRKKNQNQSGISAVALLTAFASLGYKVDAETKTAEELAKEFETAIADKATTEAATEVENLDEQVDGLNKKISTLEKEKTALKDQNDTLAAELKAEADRLKSAGLKSGEGFEESLKTKIEAEASKKAKTILLARGIKDGDEPGNDLDTDKKTKNKELTGLQRAAAAFNEQFAAP